MYFPATEDSKNIPEVFTGKNLINTTDLLTHFAN